MYKVKCKIKVSNINQSYNTDLILEKIIWLKPASIEYIGSHSGIPGR